MLILNLIFFSLLVFTFFFDHLLMMLLSLEFIVVSIINYICYLNFYMNLEFLFIYIFIFLVSEGIMGLCLMVLLIRYFGHDYCLIFNMMI